jgi:S1-C subfamily serine protease
MKKLLFLSIILSTGLHAKNITTTDGRVFKDATITKHDAVGITISHADGISRLSFEKLPDEIRKQFNYDPKLAEAQSELERKTKIQSSQTAQAARQQIKPASTHAGIDFASANDAWDKVVRSCEGDSLQKANQLSKAAADRFVDDTQIRDVSDGLQRIASAIAVIQSSKQSEKVAQPEIQRLLRNANVSDRPNPLNPSDRSGEKRAELDRTKAKDIQQRAEAAIEQANEGLVAAIDHASSISESFSQAGVLDGACALNALLKRVSAEYGVEAPSSFASESLKSKVIEAKAALDKAKRHLSDREFQPANQALQKSLEQFPSYRAAISLQAEVETAGKQFIAAYKNAEDLKQEKRYEESKSVLDALLVKVVDFQDANNLSAEINKIIANKASSMALANTKERSGNFEEAYAIYEQYNSKDDLMRVALKLAEKKEADGDFQGATAMYEKAEKGERAAGLEQKLNHQLEEYKRAKMLLAENRLDEALAIYVAYKDEKSASEALIKAGKLAESNGQFDLAIELYRKSASASDLERAQNAYRLQKELIAQGKVKEEAGDYESAVQIFENAGAMPELQGAALKYAKMLESRADYETAAQNYELAGQLAEARRIRETFAAQIASESRTTKKLSAEEVFKRNIDAVVTVITRGPMSSGHGSGFFVKKGGWVITNNHVIEDALSIKVRLNDRSEYPARVAFSSNNPDFALLKVEIPTMHKVVKLGSSESVNQGQTIFAIGTPVELNLQGTITQGIVSNKEITFRDNPVIAISAAINHGNSGGPLFTEDGKVVGINTFGLGTAAVLKSGRSIGSDIQNMNFAITIDDVKKLIDENTRE